MPIYEYKCPSCRKVFEEWVKAHDTAPKPCPDCGTIAPHIVSNTTFVLKGGGWYVTEYGNRKNGSSASSDSGSNSAKAPSDTAEESAPAGAASEKGGEKAASPLPAAPSAKEAVSAA